MSEARSSCTASAVLALVFPAHAARPKAREAPAETKPAVDPALFSALDWREIGPYRGGRSAAVTGVPSQPNLYYFGSTGGGVWKTTDGGNTWKSVSDGFFGGSIGAVAVSEWDPNVIYVGTGEKTVRGNVSAGDGVWKSTDAGKTWKHAGLADSRHIPRVRIHPRNPELVYAAVLGHLFGPNEERGVYRSADGGRSWQRVLFVNSEVGAVDLAMDPTNPRVLYASTWRVRRSPWSLESGGPGSGLWKTTDGGDTWDELTANPGQSNHGLPKGPLGIIGITVSPTNPENLYAILEAEEGGVFRSLIQTFTRKPDPGEEEKKEEEGSWSYFEAPETKLLTAKKGGNRVAWDLLLPPAERFPGLILWNDALDGPTVGAGKYQARLTVGEWSSTVPFEVRPDPRSTATAAERQAQFEFVRGVRDKLSETHREIRRLRDVRGQIDGLKKRLGKDEKAKPVIEAGEALKAKLTAIEEVLYQTKNKSAQDPLNYPVRLNDKLAGVVALAAASDGAPTAAMVAVRGELTAAIDAELAKLAAIWKDDLPAFNQLARDSEVPALALPPEKP